MWPMLAQALGMAGSSTVTAGGAGAAGGTMGGKGMLMSLQGGNGGGLGGLFGGGGMAGGQGPGSTAMQQATPNAGMTPGEQQMEDELKAKQSSAAAQQFFSGLSSFGKSLGNASGDLSTMVIPQHGSAQIIYPVYNQNPGTMDLEKLMMLISGGGAR